MKRTAIKIRKYASNVNIVDNNNLQNRIFNILIFSVIALALCYAVILISMIFNVAERQSLSVQSKNIASEVGDLELKYLAVSSKIDKTLSEEMGFKETDAKFAIRKSSLTALNFTSNEL